ncbi:MAG: hypothetical protein R3E68_00485 [Burkholderiaceae bacterium]
MQVYRVNCFLWRLLNLAYSDNFNLAEAGDRALIATLVSGEIDHFRRGGRGTEMFAVYRRRTL